MQAISITYDGDLAAYVVPAVGLAGLSSTSFLFSVVRQWWLLREQEALLAEEWAAKEEEVVGDSPEARRLFSRPGSSPEVLSVRLKLRGRSAVTDFFLSNYSPLLGKGESSIGTHVECDSCARHSSRGTSTTSNLRYSQSSGDARRWS